MSWDPYTETRPKARKNYNCDAYWEHFEPAGLFKDDLTPEEWSDVVAIKAKGGKILVGEKYLKMCGKWDNEWCTFRGSVEMNAICIKYDLYDD